MPQRLWLPVGLLPSRQQADRSELAIQQPTWRPPRQAAVQRSKEQAGGTEMQPSSEQRKTSILKDLLKKIKHLLFARIAAHAGKFG